jgi:hypothetical protein
MTSLLRKASLIEQKDVSPVNIVQPVTMLSVVLDKMRSTPNIASQITYALSSLGINILAVSSGARSFTSVIAAADTVRAVRGVHSTFNLSRQLCSVVIIGGAQGSHGSSTTAPALVAVLEEQHARLQRELWLDMRLVGALCHSGDLLFEAGGIDPKQAASLLSSTTPPPTVAPSAVAAPPTGEVLPQQGHQQSNVLEQMVLRLKGLPTPIIVDCSGEPLREDL